MVRNRQGKGRVAARRTPTVQRITRHAERLTTKRLSAFEGMSVTSLLIVSVAIVYISGIIAMIVGLQRAPVGREDRRGFHLSSEENDHHRP